MTQKQSLSLRELLTYWMQRESKIFHHGDCVGADAEAHAIALEAGYWIVIHPPIKQGLRAYCKGHETREMQSHFERNRRIVDESQLLIAAPYSIEETLGGTWYTINYAKKRGIPVRLIQPDGRVI